LLKKKRKHRGYILVHTIPWLNKRCAGLVDIISFDVVVLPEYYSKYRKLIDDGALYEVDCKIAEEWLEKNKDYVYLGSEDLAHTINGNIFVLKIIAKLINDGFEIVKADG